MIAHRLLLFAMPALLLLVMQLNIPWHILFGGGVAPPESGAVEDFENDGDIDKKANQDVKKNAASKVKRKSPSNCLIAFDGPSTMTSNEDIERIPIESKRMQQAVMEYHRRCRRENEWASELIQRRKIEELALMCERKRREAKEV